MKFENKKMKRILSCIMCCAMVFATTSCMSEKKTRKTSVPIILNIKCIAVVLLALRFVPTAAKTAVIQVTDSISMEKILLVLSTICFPRYFPHMIWAPPENRTLMVALIDMKNSSEGSTSWTLMLAASAIAILPVLLTFILCNKYYVKGLSEGAIKG